MKITSYVQSLRVAAAMALLACTSVPVLNLHAQTSSTLDPWVTVDQFVGGYDGAGAFCITVDASGNILAGGSASWSGQPGHFIIRKSTDGGATFFTLTDMVGGPPTALASDAAGNLYANSSSSPALGLLKSTDGGLTWTVIAPAPAGLAVAPDGTIFIGARDATTGACVTWRSSDGGITWVTIDNYLPRHGSVWSLGAIALDLRGGNIYLAGSEDTGQGNHMLVRRSSNGGLFSTVDIWQPKQGTAVAFAIATDANGQVYVAGRAEVRKEHHFFVRKSTTGTGSFSTVDDVLAASGTDAHPFAITVDSMNCVYVTGVLGGSGWITRKAPDGVHFSTSDIPGGGMAQGIAVSSQEVFACGNLPVDGKGTFAVRRLSP